MRQRQPERAAAAGPARTEYTFEKPLVRLLREFARRREYRQICLEHGDMRIEINAAQ